MSLSYMLAGVLGTAIACVVIALYTWAMFLGLRLILRWVGSMTVMGIVKALFFLAIWPVALPVYIMILIWRSTTVFVESFFEGYYGNSRRI